MFKRLQSGFRIRRYKWSPIVCPICGLAEGKVILARDRYLIKINLRICVGCGLIYCSRNLVGEDLRDFYINEYRNVYEDIESIDIKYVFDTKDRLKAAYRALRIREVVGDLKTVIEIGCGLGFFLLEAKKSGAQQVIGFEPGALFSKFAKRNISPEIQVINKEYLSGCSGLPAPDLVAMFHVFEHIENPGELLSKLSEQISDGYLIIEVPDIEGCWKELGLLNFHFGHRWYFSLQSLSCLLEKYGFGVVHYEESDDDGIYPGNLRVYARKLNVESAIFIKINHSVNIEAIRKKLLVGFRAPILSRGSYFRRICSLLRP